uniref:MADF domain-containing protein n=1 Tax=Ascaris lumbricoides TaxID=6252 RepID=A0A0M3IDE9_ASCLU
MKISRNIVLLSTAFLLTLAKKRNIVTVCVYAFQAEKIVTKIGKERMPRALWSNAVWCKLIKEFKARPALWCHQHPLYGDAVSTSALIHDVAEVLTKEYRSTYTDDDVSEHWNTLKSGLLQYLTKLNCWAKNFTRSSMAPSFKYARHLEFLMEDEGIISFSDTIQAMHQCDVCGSYFSSWRSLNAHKTVQCPADDCEWEGDNFAEHLHQAHPDMSLASLLKRLGSSGSLRCILLSQLQQKRLAESTSGSATSSLTDGSLNATGGAVIEKCDDVHQLASTSSNTYSMSSSCPVTHPSKRLFSCPVTDCFFRSTDFSRYNAHLVAEHPDVFKMGTSIESRESLNDGAIGDDYFVSVDAEDYEGGDEDDRPKNDDEGILHCERISANVSLVEPVKADSLMDEVECYGSKDVLLTEQRLVLEAEEGSRVEIMREIPVFESVLSKANEDMIDDAYLPLSASLVDVPEGVCFIKTENRIEQHKKMKIECGTPHSVTPLLSVHLDENPLWNDRDVSATSTLVSQGTRLPYLKFKRTWISSLPSFAPFVMNRVHIR